MVRIYDQKTLNFRFKLVLTKADFYLCNSCFPMGVLNDIKLIHKQIRFIYENFTVVTRNITMGTGEEK